MDKYNTPSKTWGTIGSIFLLLSLLKPEDKPTPPQPRKRTVVKKQFIPRERVKSESSDSTVSAVEEVEKPVTPEVEEPKETIEIAGMFYVSKTQI